MCVVYCVLFWSCLFVVFWCSLFVVCCVLCVVCGVVCCLVFLVRCCLLVSVSRLMFGVRFVSVGSYVMFNACC